MSQGPSETERGARRLRARSGVSSLALLLVSVASACDRTDYSIETSSSAGSGSAAGAGGASTTGGTGLVLPPPGAAGTLSMVTTTPPCVMPPTGEPVFAEQVVSNDAPARRELYTWTTAEQEAEIRAGSVLFTRTERVGLGPGFAMQALAALAASTQSTPEGLDVKALAAVLTGPAFSKARYAWTDPWATRVGWPGESYGDKLVRLVLRQDAWLARYRAGQLDVVDMYNQPVSTAKAIASPERIAAVYFVRDAGSGGPTCGGSFFGGDQGYREFIVGNEAMIEEWSVGTAEIRARLEADITKVQEFFDRMRVCPVGVDAETWNPTVVCSWHTATPEGEIGAYEAALAIPSENYLPTTHALAALIEALQSSLFEPDPFVVKPGEQP